jgi:hypothetical protein
MATKLEWEATLKRHGNKCVVCKITTKKVGKLEKAHLKARSKGGSQILPMCPNCHQRFDMLLLSPSECKRIGIDYADYVKKKYAPAKSKPKRDDSWW